MRLPRQRSTPQRRKSAKPRVGRDRRPVAHRRTRSSPAARPSSNGRTRRTGLTSRAAVLAIAVCAVVLTLAVPFQQYLAQRSQLGSLAAQERAERARVAALEQAQARWADPAYVRQQARERLHFVKPGETAYVIVDPTPQPRLTPVAAPKPPHGDGPWYSQLWSTVTTAASEPTKSSPAPARKPATPKPIPATWRRSPPN
jgi:cell division protein FtsB